jgi:hypothetical protein
LYWFAWQQWLTLARELGDTRTVVKKMAIDIVGKPAIGSGKHGLKGNMSGGVHVKISADKIAKDSIAIGRRLSGEGDDIQRELTEYSARN